MFLKSNDDGKNVNVKIETAKKMYEKGYPLENISYITDLSILELERVLKK